MICSNEVRGLHQPGQEISCTEAGLRGASVDSTQVDIMEEEEEVNRNRHRASEPALGRESSGRLELNGFQLAAKDNHV